MKLFELKDEKKTFWQVLGDLGIEGDEVSEFHDKQLPWVNRNDERSINRLIKSKKYRTISQLYAYVKDVLGKHNFAEKVTTAAEFKAALDTPIKVWRGGSGTFDPSKPDRDWVSATLSKDRANTFSVYDGTYSSSKVFLQKRDKNYWVVEIDCKLSDVLLYIHAGIDHEVIIPKSLQQTAKVLVQK